MIVVDALVTWLIEQAADAAHRAALKGWRGDPKNTALRAATENAIQLTAHEFFGTDEELAAELSRVIDHVFGIANIAGPQQRTSSVRGDLRADVLARMSILGDPSITGQGISSAAALGISSNYLGERLWIHLVEQIKSHGVDGGALQPLSIQLNFDQIHEHNRQTDTRLATIQDSVEQAINLRAEPTYLSDHYRLLLRERRDKANTWCTQVLGDNRDDFWEADWRERLHPIADTPQSLVLTASGGGGKSVLAAHVVRHLLQDDANNCPIVLNRPEDLRSRIIHGSLIAHVRDLIGASSAEELSRYINTMHEAHHRVLVVVDGLDALIDKMSTQDMSVLLKELANLSCLLVPCRTEVWQRFFARLSIEQRPLRPLSAKVVQRVLPSKFLTGQINLPVLRVPFYLNAALMLASGFDDLPNTETGLLKDLLRHYVKPATSPLPSARGLEPIFDRLAELQLQSTAYEVSRNALLAATQGFREANRAIEYLEDIGVVREQTSGQQLTVRLNHDLLDCFNIARLMIQYDQRRLRQLIYDHATEFAGWNVISMLIQIGHDTKDQALLRELFSELLKMLDRKHLGDTRMGRAWAATYVLRDKVTVLLPLILECLDAPETLRPDHPDSPNGSRLGPNARITQEAASSLASAFDALDDRTASRPAEAIPVLSKGLYRWKLRKRFVEALAKYHEPAAVNELIIFARKELKDQGDLVLLGEIAEALGNVGETLTEIQRRPCLQVLEEIIGAPDLDARTRRAAIEAKNRLTWPIVAVVPEIDEAEIITYLDPRDHTRDDYSDWRVVKRYAEYAYDRIVDDQLTQSLLDALLLAFTHDQLFVRTAVAACLGQADDPAARAALLGELLTPSLSWDVREACLEALDTQIREASGPVQRALLRWLVLDAAQQAAEHDLPAANGLAKLVAKWWDISEPIVTRGAFEISPPLVTTQAASAPTIDLLPTEAAPIDAWIRDLISTDDYARVGEGWEAKYRTVSVGRLDENSLAISLAPTTWEESASFHCAMIRMQPVLRSNADRIISSWLRGQTAFPGIICVHSIVVTGDNKVVKARRGSNTIYASGRWSVSFEEQLTTTDLESTAYDAVTSAALRGFREEFQLPSNTCRVRVVSAIMEFPITNLSILVAIEAEAASDAFSRALAAAQGPNRELTDVEFIDIIDNELLAEIQRPDLHPTSAVRIRVLSRLYGKDLPIS